MGPIPGTEAKVSLAELRRDIPECDSASIIRMATWTDLPNVGVASEDRRCWSAIRARPFTYARRRLHLEGVARRASACLVQNEEFLAS
jgi:hypothetical protein